MDVAATTINKVCLSGLNAIYLADLMINAGEADIVVAGGMESMTQAPYLLPGARAGYRIGDQTVVDSMMYDGLFCAFDQRAMGLSTEVYNGADGISRQRQDLDLDFFQRRQAEPGPMRAQIDPGAVATLYFPAGNSWLCLREA